MDIDRGAILITGGTGFMGRAILQRREAEKWSGRCTVFSRDEAKHVALKRRFPDVRFVLGDVRDEDRLTAAAAGHDLIIHTAAMKHIPEAEFNVLECLSVNVDGSISVAKAAMRAGVECVVGLSTDKAAAPLNTYGATKLLMERVFAEAAGWGGPSFVCVRYGNVVSSSGSVVPEFRRQIREEGEVRVTDERMSRFWISHSDAIDLIALAATGMSGTVLIPRCGAMRIMDLARAAIAAEGAECPIREVGLRPGEKVHETLLRNEESTRARWEAPHLQSAIGAHRLGVFEMLPATATERFSPTGSYSSDDPDFRYTPGEMLTMIEAAALV